MLGAGAGESGGAAGVFFGDVTSANNGGFASVSAPRWQGSCWGTVCVPLLHTLLQGAALPSCSARATSHS